MAEIRLQNIDKVYPGGTHAVHGVDLDIADGEFLILVGPSGCAKSTILRMIAGLETPTGGTIEIGGRLVNDVAPKDRDIAMVFQSYALYPHMTVAENMAFGLRLRNFGEHDIQQRIQEAARILGLEQLLDRKPRQMSGGQRQRVAMGRAIVREPQAFLMDEPLSNLDAKLRVQMRTEIAKLHNRLGTTTVYVTHDQTEAMTLGQRICILRRGSIQQVDSPYMVYTNPANIFVAGFMGSPSMNFMEGHLFADSGEVRLRLGEHIVTLPPSVTGRLLATTDINGRGVVVGVRPEHLAPVSPETHAGEANSIPMEIELTESMGNEAFVYLASDVPQPNLSDLAEAQGTGSKPTFVARFDNADGIVRGERINVSIMLSEIHLFDPVSQQTLLSPIAKVTERVVPVSEPQRAVSTALREPATQPVATAQPVAAAQPVQTASEQAVEPPRIHIPAHAAESLQAPYRVSQTVAPLPRLNAEASQTMSRVPRWLRTDKQAFVDRAMRDRQNQVVQPGAADQRSVLPAHEPLLPPIDPDRFARGA